MGAATGARLGRGPEVGVATCLEEHDARETGEPGIWRQWRGRSGVGWDSEEACGDGSRNTEG